jgi:hypothetical protein
MKTVPKLEERIMNGSEDEMSIAAELVSTVLCLDLGHEVTFLYSFVRGCLALGGMTQKA